jgi:hypothetical protein
MGTQANTCIMGYDHSLDQKDIFKFIYYFMILFLTVYIFKYFLLFVLVTKGIQ